MLTTVAVLRASDDLPHDPRLCERLLVSREASGKAEFFDDLAELLKAKRAEIKSILLAVDSPKGADYEIDQAIWTLEGIPKHEMRNLSKTRTLENIAVYGSTNIPLYSLILHAFIPASVSKNVWFRTPAVSREVYAKLFELIRAELKDPARLDGIHILTEPRDVQYDNFRKKHVLGLNNKGKRAERAPSEVVIFTGKPETGREIFETNVEKSRQLGEAITPYEQIYLMFGSGMNPIIVTGEARDYLNDVVEKVIEPIRINASQDCIAPTFCAVSSKVKPALIDKLVPELTKLRLSTDRTDVTADFFPLVFSESVDPLIAYREKYRDYLLTPNAKIDSATMAVEPHLFVFPISMWGQVELTQHYAPFVVFFEYHSLAELESIARDPRVMDRAMFASVFGTKGAHETELAARYFRQTGHEVQVNKDFLTEEDGNYPFGGTTPNASAVLYVKKHDVGKHETLTEARPLLFSKEAADYFPEKPKP